MNVVKILGKILVAVTAGRFDASLDAVQARCRRAMKLADIYLSTEVMSDQRPAFHAPGCKAAFFSEYAILYRVKVWDLRGGPKLIWLTKKITFSRGRIRIRPRQLSVRMKHLPTGIIVYFDLNHLPAHLQRGNEFTSEKEHQDEVRSHRHGTRSAGRLARRRKRSHPERPQLWSADVNVDQMLERWREYMQESLSLDPVWRKDNLPPIGDLGKRLIIGSWTYRVADTSARIYLTPAAEEGLDHRLMVLEGTLEG